MVQAEGSTERKMDLRFRKATYEDTPFLMACVWRLPYDTEGKVADVPNIFAGLKTFLANPKLGYYVIVYDENDPLKHPLAMGQTSYELNFELGGVIMMVHTLFVEEWARKKGVIKFMMKTWIQMAKDDPNIKGVKTIVDYHNEPSMRAHASFGMTPRKEHIFVEADWIWGGVKL